MALQPGTNKQIPDNAILDRFDKQAYLGNQYCAATGVISLSNTAETPLLYLGDPATTTGAFPVNAISLFLRTRKLICYDVSDATAAVFRLYINPSTISGGTPLTPSNNRLGSSFTSVATATISPTVGSKGTLVYTFPAWGDYPDITTDMLFW